jgi:arsenite oxidase large subunit
MINRDLLGSLVDRIKSARCVNLALESGTDLVLFNALLTYIADKGWIDKAFIAASTLPAGQATALLSRPGGALTDQPLTDFASALAANRTSIEDAAKITGLKAEDIIKAAQWIAEPKAGGKRRRTCSATKRASSGATTITVPTVRS